MKGSAWFAAVTLALLIAALCILPDRLAFSGGDSYAFYTGTSSSNCAIVQADPETAALERLLLTDVRGECATYASLDIDKLLEEVHGEVVFTEELSDSTNYYCTADLPYSVELYGRRINLHICVRGDSVKVATPIIFGGY